MQVQTKRSNGFAAVLKGTHFSVALCNDHIELSAFGTKGQTTERYEFRVLLTLAEWQVIRKVITAGCREQTQ